MDGSSSSVPAAASGDSSSTAEQAHPKARKQQDAVAPAAETTRTVCFRFQGDGDDHPTTRFEQVLVVAALPEPVLHGRFIPPAKTA